MTTAQELQKRFHACMPLFIALGDEMRLSIIEVLTEEALESRQTPGPPTGWITVPTGLRPESGCYTEPWEWVGAGWHPMCFTAVWRCS